MRTLYFAGLLLTVTLLSVMNVVCQSTVGGMTLPSPYYLEDDTQYFPAGSEQPLYNERAALQKASEEETIKRL